MSFMKFLNKARSFMAESKKESLSKYLDCCKYTLTSNTEIVIEGEILIEDYSDTKILFYEKSNIVKVEGKNLELCYLKANTAKIYGDIYSIVFHSEDFNV